jgi:tripartite-type tricarboxylate transporter receptor subunit TctC
MRKRPAHCLLLKFARLVAGLGLVVSSAALLAKAQTARYPARTIEITVSYAACGSTDLVARAIAQKFQERLGQSAVVRNLPGASGTIGAAAAARANSDGHALMSASRPRRWWFRRSPRMRNTRSMISSRSP